jgi:AbrB family looped-hinge helix DNA binding protein
MSIVTVSKKGWVVIPKEVRERNHIKPGDKLVIIDYGRGISIFPASKDPIREARGMLKGGPSMKEFLEEKQRELEEEERYLPPPPPPPEK